MLWLALYFPHFALELRPSHDAPLAIVEKHGNRRYLIACNQAARAKQVHRGLDAATALARLPGLKLVERSKSAELQAMKAVAAWAEQYSNTVHFDASRWMLWIEIGASLAYFGGLDSLRQHVDESIESLGYTAQQGIAPTVECAALLAVHPNDSFLTHHPSPITHHASKNVVVRKSEIIAAIAPLPLRLLYFPGDTLDALHGLGWKTIGEVLSVPREQLSRRFGSDAASYLHKLLGDEADPRKAYRAPATYRRRFDLADPVHVVEALLFPLRRLLGELQGYLRGRDTALQQLTLELRHPKQPPTLLELRTTAPQRDSGRLLALLREQLDRTPLPDDVIELVLSVDRFVDLGDTQLDLFDTRPQKANDWGDLLDKLRARLGDQAVRRLGLRDDHRPEQAWCVVKQEEIEKTSVALGADEPERPFWLLEPTPLRQLPRLLGKPERIEDGWWTGDECRRDYYIAETAEGSRWWLYRDEQTKHWFLHGVWS